MSFKPDSHWNFLSVNYGPEDDNLANAAAALLLHQLINHPDWIRKMCSFTFIINSCREMEKFWGPKSPFQLFHSVRAAGSSD